MKSSKYRCFISSGHKGATNNHGMLAIKARCRKIIVDMVYLKTFEWIEVILRPFPCASCRIIVTGMGRRKVVHWILAAVGKIKICPGRSFGELLTGSDHDFVGRNILTGGGKAVILVTNDMVLGLCQQAVRFGSRRSFRLVLKRGGEGRLLS